MKKLPPRESDDKKEGVSLIAISVILTVGALIMVSLLPGAGNVNKKSLNSIQKLQKVEEAMKGFMAQNMRRPCPASGQYGVSNPLFGIEAASPNAASPCTGGIPAAPLGPDAGTNHVVGGVIPTKTLGLDDSYALDEWGHRFTYIVDQRAAYFYPYSATWTPGTALPTCYGQMDNIKFGSTPAIIIKDGMGAMIDQVMYAYISHGPDGEGAFPAQGSDAAHRIMTGNKDPDKLINAGVNSSFTYSPANFTNVRVRKNPTPTFRDIVYYADYLKNNCCVGNACNVGFQANGATANYFMGRALAIGDINGDGIPDLVIGSWNAGYNGANSGTVYVVFGTKYGFPNPLPLGSLNGINGFELDGVSANDQAGYSVAIGDVNGDGIADLIIGAAGVNSGAGAVYVVFGKAAGWPVTSTPLNAVFLNGINGVELDGPTAGYHLGNAVATGDVNGDGVSDIVIGAWNASYTLPGAGAVYVVLGKTAGWSAAPTSLALGGPLIDGIQGYRIDGVSAADNAGGSLAVADINGDGYADMIIGAWTASYTAPQSGSVYGVFGRGGAWSIGPPPTLGTLSDGIHGFRLDNPAVAGAGAGQSTAAGDVNGDGMADIIIGAPDSTPHGGNSGSVYIVFGRKLGWPAAPATLDSSLLNGTDGFQLDGPTAGIFAGWAVATGDINHDGIADIIINASKASSANGAAYVVFGKLSGWSGTSTPLDSSLLNGVTGFEIDGMAGDNGFLNLATGDVNGDGVTDLIIGAPFADVGGNSNAGLVYVMFGQKQGYPWPAKRTSTALK